jgi:ligand-binding SRPBCC domain-containing protein
MKIHISTPVAQSARRIYEGFDENLFRALAPAFPKLEILRFDGSKIDDEIHINLNVLGWKIRWDAIITAYNETDDAIYFVDEGKKLPFFLKSWQHKHIMKKSDTGSVIVDDITFSSGWWGLDFLLYPALYGQFYQRKPVYKRYFA